MLLALHIENFALVDALTLSFGQGLNVLTGETGAGKSIILDAIDAALGGKVNGRLLRTGTQRGKVEATFQLTDAIAQWLQQQDIDALDEPELICSRDLTASGETVRSRSRINGVLVNRQVIQELRELLIEVTAQGQTVQLLLPNRQRDLLDTYGGKTLLKAKQRVAQAYGDYRAAVQALETREKQQQDRLQRLDVLEFQLRELNEAELDAPEELTELEQELERLAHVVELQNLSYQSYQLLYQNEQGGLAIADQLGNVEGMVKNMVNYDSSLTPVLEMVLGALNQVVEAGQQLNRYGDLLEADPERLQEVENRLGTLKQICRKYGPELKDAIALWQALQTELDDLTGAGQSLEELVAERDRTHQILLDACQTLTQHRQTAAQKLQKQLIRELKPLAMAKVQFDCRLRPIEPTSAGAEQINFWFSPNPGEPLQSLAETASGGEMSRFLLALKSCLTQGTASQHQRTLIFDEIDTGVSGKVAQAIAEKLNQLSQPHQILCVTHQPLIAALADRHFRVDKTAVKPRGQDPRTIVNVTSLETQDSRATELAQLAGGHAATDAIAFAQSLLAQAQTLREK
ncbi:MAG: DNA repair protein RecN [Spirulina sp. SIO3F2]|nr:DNA repair protein RecN [Spirulina sp. SIO3F2]